MHTPPVVSPQAWQAAREQLLVKEKAQTRARDALAAERRRLPWMAVEKAYAFEGPTGKASLLDLFDGRRQLIVYRAFFEPGVFGWPDHACRGCSMVADQVAHVAHLNARDTTLVFVSRAPQADIARLKARMGWEMPWFTLTDSFDADFGVDEWHGTNVFCRDGDRVFRTYFINNRGDEQMGSTWNYLDITPLGRQEVWEDSPEGYPQTRPISGGTGTTAMSKRRTRNGSRCRTPERRRSGSNRRALAESDALIDELERADLFVIGVPMSRLPSASAASECLAGRMEDTNEKGHHRGVCVAGRRDAGTGWAERGSNAKLQVGRLGGAVHG
jgi:predicted dithiol-disulfide oxidoreductase (DUF899 family)